jgi:dATP/dGTP diphosphohydrolase/uncharacterized protein DUF4406
MSGIECFNFAAFDRAAELGRARGWDVVSPAEHDRAMGLDETDYPTGDVQKLMTERPTFMIGTVEWDLEQVRQCDAIALLPGWSASTGARAELAVAVWLRKRVLDARTFNDYEFSPAEAKVTVVNTRACLPGGGLFESDQMDEVRTVSATGGEKGVKPERYDLIPWDAMDEVAKAYAFGATKYADRNWEKGYEVGKSIAAAFRHLRAHAMGQEFDSEAASLGWKVRHLGQVGFHVLALLAWLLRGTEARDDRAKVWA